MSMLQTTRRALLGGRRFNPAHVAGLTLWLKADAGLYQDAAKTTPATSDGDVVGAWEDQSGNGSDATQATTSKKPLLKLGIVNSKPVVRFDGVDDQLDTANQFYVRQYYAAFTSLVTPYNDFGTVLGNLALLGNRLGCFNSGNTNWYTTPFPVAVWRNAVSLISPFNMAPVNVFMLETVSAANPNALRGYQVGGQEGTRHGNLDIAEVLGYDSVLSTTNRQAVESYLDAKYNIT